jgi:hypothetical protein
MKVLGVLGCCMGLLSGCAAMDLFQIPLTRTERELYTIVLRDTLQRSRLVPPPGETPRGVLFPTARQVHSSQELLLHDSVVERHYPNFIRFGLFESVGLIGTAPAGEGYGAGLFGLFPDRLDWGNPAGGHLFTGAWYRLLPVEYRFRWFDAPDWSIGSAALEGLQLSRNEALVGILPLYLRKRWYWQDLPPYAALSLGGGVSIFPSQYVNLFGSAELGSLGGVNLRAYAGIVLGQTPANSRWSSSAQGTSLTQPYAGIGVSLMDFLNRERELEEEWQYHRHSAWSVGIGQFAFLRSGTERSIWTEGSSPLLTGMVARLLPVQLAAPLPQLPGLYAGTALGSIVIMGTDAGGVGILPLRLGYWQELVPGALALDGSAEWLYYPSSVLHLSGRLVLRTSDLTNLFLVAGFASGSVLRATELDWDILRRSAHFQGWYIGIGMGLLERIFRRADLWYFR